MDLKERLEIFAEVIGSVKHLPEITESELQTDRKPMEKAEIVINETNVRVYVFGIIERKKGVITGEGFFGNPGQHSYSLLFSYEKPKDGCNGNFYDYEHPLEEISSYTQLELLPQA